MKHLFYTLTAIAGIALVTVFGTGCKENTLISSKISPANDTAMVQSRSLSCITHTYFDDTIITSTNLGGIPIYQAVGNVLDPYAGVTTAATYFQVVPNTLGFYFGAPYQIDSAVLIMPYSGFTWGDSANTTLTQSYQVFALTDTLGYYSNYYPFTTKATGQAFSDVVTVNLHNLQDSVSVFGIMQHPHMRMRLNDAFLQYIDSSADVKATDPTTFMNAFPGFCVRPADSRPSAATGAMPYFELDGVDAYSQAGVVVYYHTVGAIVPDTLLATYPFNIGYCSHFNTVKRNYAHYPLGGLYISSRANDSIIALQNQPGAGIDLVVQNILDSLPKNIVINKAEVQISILPQSHTDSIFFAPQRLYPISIGPNGGNLVADVYPTTSTSPLALLDGYAHNFTYSTGSTNITTYTINIPRELQASISAGQNTLHLHINGSQNFYGAYRMLAGGGNYSDPHYRAKLFVVYSKLSK